MIKWIFNVNVNSENHVKVQHEISRRNRAGELACKGCDFVGHMKLLVAQGSARYRCPECKKEHRIGELV